MNKSAEATFEIKSWDEAALNDMEGLQKLARVSSTTTLKGDFEGEGAQEYLMTYGEDGTAHFVGFERVRGQVNGRSGAFVLQHIGTFTEGVAKSNFVVVPGSGTGELLGLSGTGHYVADSGNAPLTLNYTLE